MQFPGSARTSHEIVIAKNEQIADLDAHIGQLEGQVEERDALLDERDADFALLEQQFTTQQVQLNAAFDQGISGLDTMSGVPLPPLPGAHSPVRSESSVNNLDDF